MAINAGFGAYTMFGKPAEYGTFRTVHRIIGFAVTGAALWLTAAAAIDDNVASHVKYVSGDYTALSVVPLIIFKF